MALNDDRFHLAEFNWQIIFPGNFIFMFIPGS